MQLFLLVQTKTIQFCGICPIRDDRGCGGETENVSWAGNASDEIASCKSKERTRKLRINFRSFVASINHSLGYLSRGIKSTQNCCAHLWKKRCFIGHLLRWCNGKIGRLVTIRTRFRVQIKNISIFEVTIYCRIFIVYNVMGCVATTG